MKMMPFPSQRTIKIISAGFFLLALVGQHIQAMRLGYQVEKARHQIQSLRCSKAALQIEVETLLSPARLCAQARNQLKMSLTPPSSMRFMDTGSLPVERPNLLQRLFAKTWKVLATSSSHT